MSEEIEEQLEPYRHQLNGEDDVLYDNYHKRHNSIDAMSSKDNLWRRTKQRIDEQKAYFSNQSDIYKEYYAEGEGQWLLEQQRRRDEVFLKKLLLFIMVVILIWGVFLLISSL